MTSSYEIASKRIQELLEAYFKIKKKSGEQETESMIRVKVGLESAPKDNSLSSLAKPHAAKRCSS